MEDQQNKLNDVIFQSFVNRFKARYGENSMNPETMLMFYGKCGHIPSNEFEEVTTIIFGKRDRVFGWFLIIETYNSMFNNPGQETPENIRSWKKEANQGNQNHRKRLMQLMTQLISNISSERIGPEWRKEYAQKFVDVLGENEARKQLSGIKNFDPIFTLAVLDLLPTRSSF